MTTRRARTMRAVTSVRDIGATVIAGIVRIFAIVVLLVVLGLLMVVGRLGANIKRLAALQRALIMNSRLFLVVACFGFLEDAE